MATEKRILIYLDELVTLLARTYKMTMNEHIYSPNDILSSMQGINPVDAVEVVHGEWTIIEDDYCGLIGLECSHCETTWWFDEESPIREYHYCPECGADMRERKDNE